MILTGGVVLLASIVFGSVNYERERAALLHGIDQELYAAAHLASLVPPAGYFDGLVDASSVSAGEYDELVARNNALCRQLDLQYLWSCMQVGDDIVFTTSTSPGHDVDAQDHAKFFDIHQDPHAFDAVFATMAPDYSSFHNEWGHGRMVLVPSVDARGRKYCYGASMSIDEVHVRLRTLLRDTVLISLSILAASLLVAWYFAFRLIRPLARITDVAAAISRGELDAAGDDPRSLSFGSRTFEIAVLARSVTAMGRAIQNRLRELGESEAQQRIILDSIGDAVIATDLRGRISRMNPVAEELTGWSLVDALGHEFDRVVQLSDPETDAPAEDLLQLDSIDPRDANHVGDLYLTAQDSTEHRVTVTVSRIRSGGSMQGAVVVLRDVTERHAVEEQLSQAQKMEAIGQLAGGIAHDFNNMLAGITGSTEMLQHLVGDSPPARRYIEILTASAERAADLVGKLLTFAHKGKMESTPVDLHEVLLTSVALLERSIGKGIRLETRLDATSSIVVGDPAQLQSAVLNLALNARDAMPEGGELVITTEDSTVGQEDGNLLGLELPPGRYIHLAVRDTGCGMDNETCSRIFEPFFTTKEVGKGTGLGLPAVYGTIRDHRGGVRVDSAIDEGTTFHIYLPQAEDVSLPSEDSTEVAAPGKGGVLVIDDEELVRAMARGLLEHLGYRPYLAEDGVEGVRVYQDNRDQIDVVILDVVMPRMDGRMCLNALKAIDPDVVVLVASGFTSEQTVNEFTKAGAAGFIKKPFTLTEFARALVKALRSGNGNG